jgi:transposase
MEQNRKNRRYGPDFRQRAMGLARELGNATEAAKKLGIPKFTLQTWIWNDRQKNQPSNLNQEISPEEQLRQLKRENEELKKANYILKQAAAFFSQDHLK